MVTKILTEEHKASIGQAIREKGARGERHGMSVLTSEKVLSMVNDYKTGLFSQRQLASLYGVSRGTVTDIIQGWT